MTHRTHKARVYHAIDGRVIALTTMKASPQLQIGSNEWED
jgi:hypothetical protein